MSSHRFGDAAHFAIEVGTDATDASPRGVVWGHMRVWLAGTPIGRFEEKHCGLSGPLHDLENLASHLDSLWDNHLSGLNDRDIHSYLYRALYSDDPTKSNYDVKLASDTFSRFIFLTNSSECFNEYNGFMFRRPGEDPIVVVTTVDDLFVRASVRPNAFTDSVREFGLWHASAQVRRLTNGSSDHGAHRR
jgi:hypothetical protein